MSMWNEWKAKRELNEGNAQIGKIVQGIGMEQDEEGVHLVIQTPDGRSGPTSALQRINSTRQPGDNGGTLYLAKTLSGSNYTVEMQDDVAKQVLQAFYSPQGQAQTTLGAAQATGNLRGGARGGRSAKFVLGSETGD